MKVFFDTNILVYLFDSRAPDKQSRARELFRRHREDGSLLLSTQVLQELYVALTRKLSAPLSAPDATEAVQRLATFSLVHIDAPLIMQAAERSQRAIVSFWNGLILEAALSGGATKLLSEDMQHAQAVAHLVIENPFLSCKPIRQEASK